MVEKAYCKYGGDFSQRHLEGSKVNWAMKGGGVVQERKGREREQRALGTPRPKAPRDCMSKLAGYIGVRLGKGKKKPCPWEGEV